MTVPTEPPPVSPWQGRRWLTFLIAFVALLAPMVLWALASPLMSVPDEPSHAIRAAAVARGEVTVTPWASNPALAAAVVPENIANGHELICFAFKTDKTADCQAAVRNTDERLVTTGTSAGLNSPVYYALVGWPSLFLGGDAAFFGMRIVNAILCAAALAVMIMQLTLLPRWRWAMVGAVVGITPMVVYLGGSINPNGLEVAAAGALFATVLATFRGTQRGRLLWEQCGLALATTALLISTRSISLLWVVIATVVGLLLGNRERIRELFRTPATWVLIAAIALISGLTTLWYVNPPVLGSEGTPNAAPDPIGLTYAFLFTLWRSADWVFGMIGFFGWVDTAAPAVTIAAWITPMLAIVVASLIWGRKHTKWAVWVLLAVVVLVPGFTQLGVYTEYGFIWQGRYMLAMLLCLLVVAGLSLDDAELRTDFRSVRLITTAFALLWLGHALAFMMTLRRYIVGSDGDLATMLFGSGWEPPFGWKTLTVLFALTVAAGCFLARMLFVRAPGAESGPGSAASIETGPTRDSHTDLDLAGSDVQGRATTSKM